jgi:hypothetical protein
MFIPRISLTTDQINAFLSFVTSSTSWEAYRANTNPNKLPTTSFPILTQQSAVDLLFAIANSINSSNVNSNATSVILSQFLVSMSDVQLSALKLSTLPYVPAGYPDYVDDCGGLMAWILSKASIAHLNTRIIQSIPYGQSVNDGYALQYLSLATFTSLGLNAFNASVSTLSGNLTAVQLQNLNREQLIAYFQPWLDNINLPANASTKTARMQFLKGLAWDNLTYLQRESLFNYYSLNENTSFMDKLRSIMVGGSSLVNVNPLEASINPYIVNLLRWSTPARRNRYAMGLVNNVLDVPANAAYLTSLSQDILRRLYNALDTSKGNDYGVRQYIFDAWNRPEKVQRFGIKSILTYTKADGTSLFSSAAIRSLSWDFLRTYPTQELSRISIDAWNAILAKMSNPTGSATAFRFQITQAGVGGRFEYGNIGVFPRFLYGILLGDPSGFDDQLLDRHAGFGAVGQIFSADYLNSIPRANISKFSAVVLNSVKIETLQELSSDFCEALSLSVMPALNVARADIILRKLTANFYNNLTDAQMAELNLSFTHFPYMSATTVSNLNANFFNRIASGWVSGLNYPYLSCISKPEVILGLHSSFLNAISATVTDQVQRNFFNNLSLEAFLSNQFLELTSAQINTALNVFKISNHLSDAARVLLTHILNKLTRGQVIGSSTSIGLDYSLVKLCLLVTDISYLTPSFIENLFALYKNKGGELPLTLDQMNALNMQQVNAIFMNYCDMSAQTYILVPDSILNALTNDQLGMVDNQVWAHCVSNGNMNHGRRLIKSFDQQVNSLIDTFYDTADSYYSPSFFNMIFGSSEDRRKTMEDAWAALSGKMNSSTTDKNLSGRTVVRLIEICNNREYEAFVPANILIPNIPYLNITEANFTTEQKQLLVTFAGNYVSSFSVEMIKNMLTNENGRSIVTEFSTNILFATGMANSINALDSNQASELGAGFFENLPIPIIGNLSKENIGRYSVGLLNQMPSVWISSLIKDDVKKISLNIFSQLNFYFLKEISADEFSLSQLKKLVIDMPQIFSQLCDNSATFRNAVISRINGLSNKTMTKLTERFFESLPATISNGLKWSSKSGWGQINVLAAVNFLTNSSYKDNPVNNAIPANLNVIKFDDAWSAGFRGQGVTVAVIDSGIDLTVNHLYTNLSNDSKSFIPGDDSIHDPTGHGSLLAGAITGKLMNISGELVAGGAPDAILMALKSTDYGENGGLYSAIDAIRYATDHGAKIIEMALDYLWTGALEGVEEGQKADFQEAVAYAESRGVLLVFCAGDNSNGGPLYPGVLGKSMSNVLTVGTSTLTTIGDGLLAPNTNIAGTVLPYNYVTAPGYNFNVFLGESGTKLGVSSSSYASACVSAAAAVLWSANPDLTAAQIIEALIRTATSTRSFESNRPRKTQEEIDALPYGDEIVDEAVSADNLVNSMSAFSSTTGGSSTSSTGVNDAPLSQPPVITGNNQTGVF